MIDFIIMCGWFLASIFIAIFLYFFFIPWLLLQWVMFKLHRTLRRIAKNAKTEEEKKMYNEIAKLAKQVAKDEKL